MIIVTSSFSKGSVFKMFFVQAKMPNRRFQIPLVRSRRDGLVWSVDLIVGIKLRFRISRTQFWGIYDTS